MQKTPWKIQEHPSDTFRKILGNPGDIMGKSGKIQEYFKHTIQIKKKGGSES